MKRVLAWIAGSFAVTAILLAVTLVYSSTSVSALDLLEPACTASANSAACPGSGAETITGTDGVILRAANIMAVISGIVAVFMMMLGGFYFITAGGDSNKVSSARKTIIYSVVGLIVIVMARTIVVFVVTRV